ncbi:glycosyltransferase family 2 protein [Adlercreutzia sp. ZJ141]|uniref:glycosyltransferase family 2 protein n=1 Tax=Adlercreutzia sp. ZJ141 TaxID=2709406 RepID=UPI0013E9DE00|nr:glycosyltransferase family 2 protein [Adlercreutzia sp. ZJ141]
MRFSIVVPVYNVERYLPHCLESIRSQGFAGFEVVLVNDGSTDGSSDLCEDFSNTSGFPVVVVNQANKGLLAARRAGFAASSGDYLISLDSDDVLHPDALRKIDEAITRTEAEVVLFGFSRKEDFSDPSFPPMVADRVYDSDEMRQLFCSTNRMNAMCFKAVARPCVGPEILFEQFGCLNMGEDAVQSAIIFDRARSAVLISEVLYFYRPNRASISSRIGRSYLVDMEKVQTNLAAYANKWDGGCDVGRYTRAFAPRCIEEICHFVLHYTSNIGFRESREALEAAAASPFVAACLNDRSLLAEHTLHTRFVAHLLSARRLRLVWVLARVRRLFSSLMRGC